MDETQEPTEPRPWVPDDRTPHTYAVPSSGTPAPEPPLPPAYGHPLPSLGRRRTSRRWRRLRRAIGRVFPAFDVSDDHR